MGRSPCCAKEGLNRGAWTATEDKILTEYIKIHGEGNWRNLPRRAGLKRCGKSCRLRWLNYLRPGIKRGNITHDEEELIIRLHKLLGNRWSLIAGRLPGRTDNEIKNYWNTYIGKKLQASPVSPQTRRSSSDQSNDKPNPSTEEFKGDPYKQNTGPRVVRTKASRCSRAVIFGTSQTQIVEHLQDSNSLISEPVINHQPIDETTAVIQTLSPLVFVEDFEMDEHFLSDILNDDFSQSSCLADGNDCINTNNIPDRGKSSTSFHENLPLDVAMFEGSSFEVSELMNWLHD